jgi:hypothetical protein
MNVYEKLNVCREEFQQTKIKKSGKNKFANYEYFELGDFLTVINTLNKKHGLISLVSFPGETAIMRIVNTEKPEEIIEFISPFGSAELKGCHPVQNIGAVETYQRRYLYMTAYEIVEHDALDAVTGNKKTEPEDEAKTLLTKINAYKSVSALSADQKDFIDTIAEQAKKRPVSARASYLKDMLKRIQDSINPENSATKEARMEAEKNKEPF